MSDFQLKPRHFCIMFCNSGSYLKLSPNFLWHCSVKLRGWYYFVTARGRYESRFLSVNTWEGSLLINPGCRWMSSKWLSLPPQLGGSSLITTVRLWKCWLPIRPPLTVRRTRVTWWLRGQGSHLLTTIVGSHYWLASMKVLSSYLDSPDTTLVVAVGHLIMASLGWKNRFSPWPLLVVG